MSKPRPTHSIESLNVYWRELYQNRPMLAAENLPGLELNAALNKPAFVREKNWVPSPASGVQRILLERQGGELTKRATSLVAYQANSRFNAHTHPLGEEFLVLAGVFSDEYGDYPAGTYVRNPPASSHSPFTKQGCLILVKLQQMPVDDCQRIVTNALQQASGEQMLFNDYEKVSMLTSSHEPVHSQTQEGLVLQGSAQVAGQTLQVGDWFRYSNEQAITLAPNSLVFSKREHLS
ncbi:cupin domain-containing protein [Salinibius halmophilus]|uniref:cupin domain-containing protein n=1 Tax=Salinibius halmophilus TaxID=1853216 RepID=UPI001F390570|nr:cupin domain-containing protein [Salinibius halmophilus]